MSSSWFGAPRIKNQYMKDQRFLLGLVIFLFPLGQYLFVAPVLLRPTDDPSLRPDVFAGEQY